ncbi:uncharacterized protein LOC134837291 [Culicoides brevitarsis]|uniref:uncharacterized protein LOC134837291 n=1 Tax=Culicoides brevitarsis TaxID=469753 RepID=UPI00307CA1C5
MYQSSFWYPTNYIDTWRPIFYLTKLLGYAPVSRENAKIQISSMDFTFPLIAFVVYFAILCLTVLWKTSQLAASPISDTAILDIGLNVSVLLCNITAVVIVASNYVNRVKICAISRGIQAIDDELIKLGHQINYRRELVVHVTIVFATFIAQLLLYGACWVLREKYKIETLPDRVAFLYVGVTITYSVYMSNFIFIMATLEKRYKAINQTMKMYFVKKPLSLKPGLGHVCTKLAKLHDQMGDNVDAVNETFAFQINAPVANAFIFTVFCIFQLFHLMQGPSNVGMALLTFIWNIYYTSFVIGVFYIASKLTNTGKKTAMVVHKAINLSPNSENVDKLRVFSQQLLHRPPIVTSGFFDYNWELFFGLLGSGTMYLIILIQFDT